MHTPSRLLLHLALAFALTCPVAACSRDAHETAAPAGAPQEPEPGAISPRELAARLEAGSPPVVLDVRSPEEFASGHVPGARNVPVGELAERLPELDIPHDQEIVVHCEKGGRAKLAEAVLRDAGYTDVRDLTGHMSAWREDGLPVE